MGDLSANFSLHEFGLPAAKAAEFGFQETPYPKEWIDSRLRPLVKVLEALRAKLGGRPVTVISGFRPREYDLKRIAAGRKGVSPKSQHGEGRAADIQVAGCSPETVYAAAKALFGTGAIELGGLGIYDSFVHLDVRPGPLRTWDERSK